jgi:hypothetical protein
MRGKQDNEPAFSELPADFESNAAICSRYQCYRFFGHELLAVLLIRDMLHPLDDLAIRALLNGDMRHRGRGCSSMPVLLTRREPDHITRVNLFDGPAFTLDPTTTGGDD